jgi:hypothetical protein
MESNDFAVVINEKNGTTREVKAKPEVITKEPEEAITGTTMQCALSPLPQTHIFKGPTGIIAGCSADIFCSCCGSSDFAITGSDFILMAMSPISHETYLKAIEPYIGKNTLIVGLPGSPGFNTDNSATCFGYMPNSPVDAGANTHFASPE